MEYSFRREEQETILIYNRATGCWECSTNIPAHMNKLEKQGWTKTSDLGYEKAFKAPKNAITFRNLTIKRRTLTEEERKAASDRMRKLFKVEAEDDDRK